MSSMAAHSAPLLQERLNPDWHLQQAEYWLSQARSTPARQEFLRAQALDGPDFEISIGLGCACLVENDGASALSWFAPWEEVRAQETAPFLAAASAQCGRLDEARDHIKLDRLTVQTKDPKLWLARACYYYCLDNELAEMCCRRMLQLDEQYAPALFIRAFRFLAKGSYPAARELFEDLYDRLPDSAPAVYGLGYCLYGQGKLAECSELLKSARDRKVWRVGLLELHGLLQMERRRYASALSIFERLQSHAGHEHDAIRHRIVCLCRMKRYRDILALVDQAGPALDKWADGWKYRALALRATDSEVESFEAFEQYLGFRPNDHEIWCELGVGYLRHGWYDDAERVLQRLQQTAPQSASHFYLLALFASQEDRHRDAYDGFLNVLQLKPMSSMAHFHAGQELSSLMGNRVDKAVVRHWQKAIQLDPRNEYAWYSLIWTAVEHFNEDMGVCAGERSERFLVSVGKAPVMHDLAVRSGCPAGFFEDLMGRFEGYRLKWLEVAGDLLRRGYGHCVKRAQVMARRGVLAGAWSNATAKEFGVDA